MAKRDYYQVLGVGRSASADQIKRAYRSLARKHHPDRNKNDATAVAKFKEVQEAYDVLSDAKKRQVYDQFGHAGVGPGGPGGPYRTYSWRAGSGPRGSEGVDFSNLGDLNDVFSEFFGGRRGSPFGAGAASGRSAQRGADIEQRVQLTFAQAVRGTTIELKAEHSDHGSETIRVKIPPGVEAGSRVRVRGRGQLGRGGGPPGDLYIVANVEGHPFLRRNGQDLSVELPVSIREAVLGAKIDCPTLDGMTVVTIPPGTSSGTRLRLRGLGLRGTNGRRGDLYAVVKIVVPSKVSQETARRLEQFEQEAAYDPRAQVPWRKG